MAKASGRVVRREKNGRTKVVRTSSARWSPEAEEAFLEELASTCNVTAAADAAGFSTTAIYKRRMREAGFAAAWDDALGQGYARLEAMLVARATDSLGHGPFVGKDGPAAKMSVDQIMNLLKLHRASVRGGAAQNYSHRQLAPDIDEVRASILRKMDALDRAEAKKGRRRSPV